MSDEPWATPEDLEKRWRSLTQGEKERAAVLIEDATSLIQDQCPRWKQSSVQTRRRIVCAVVKRAMPAAEAEQGAPVSAQMITAGPYTQQTTFANPSGDLYLTKRERQDINGGRRVAYQVDLLASEGEQ